MIKYLTLAAALCAASLPALALASQAHAQPSGAGGDYFGGGPLTPYPGEVPAGASPLLSPLPYPTRDELARPLLSPTEQRIQELEQQNRLLSQEWTQQILQDALQRQRDALRR